MHINKIELDNGAIHFSKNDIDLGSYGIYLLQGKNGVGKTTLIEQILFRDVDISFQCKEQQEAYYNQRFRLCAYVPQDIFQIDLTVQEYLSMGGDFSKEQFEEYAGVLNIGYIDLKQNFVMLSGGEKIKIAIIAAVMKNTPYLFMDEPTNHLDDTSVRELITLLERIAVNKTIVIITHDDRLLSKPYRHFVMINGEIQQEALEKDARKNLEIPVIKKDISNSRLLRYRLSKWSILLSVIICVTFLGLMILNSNKYEYRFDDEHLKLDPNVIIIYGSFPEIPEMNMDYLKERGLLQQYNKDSQGITYNDVHSIHTWKGINRMVLLDNSPVLNNILAANIYKLLQREIDWEPLLVGVPEVASNNGALFSVLQYRLLCGRYPKNAAYEICIPRNLVAYYLGSGGQKDEEILEKEITCDKQTYKIVGLLDNIEERICLCSYYCGNDICFFEYSDPLYNMKADELEISDQTVEEYLRNKGASACDGLILYVDKGQEKNILDNILLYYPRNVVYSQEFNNILLARYKREFYLKELLPYNIFMAFAVGVLLAIINRQNVKKDRLLLKNMINYYLCPDRIYKRYYRLFLLQYLVLASVVLLGCIWKSSFYENLFFLGFDLIVCLLCIMLSFAGGMKCVSQRYS